MSDLSILPRAVDVRRLRQTVCSELDVDAHYSGDLRVVNPATGKVVLRVAELEDEPTDLAAAVAAVKLNGRFRTNGMPTESRVFGFQPRYVLRQDYCMAATIAREHPREAAVLDAWAEKLALEYERENGALYWLHRSLVESVLPAWRMRGGVFTSGIINRNNALRYHTDTGNFPRVWSVMVVLPRDVEGGSLVLPELNLAVGFPKPAIVMFAGQELLHGVSAITKTARGGARYSVVFYAMRGMCLCGTPREELARIRRKSTEREAKRARGILPEPKKKAT